MKSLLSSRRNFDFIGLNFDINIKSIKKSPRKARITTDNLTINISANPCNPWLKSNNNILHNSFIQKNTLNNKEIYRENIKKSPRKARTNTDNLTINIRANPCNPWLKSNNNILHNSFIQKNTLNNKEIYRENIKNHHGKHGQTRII